ncbi:MAG TPA: hypothetical protein VK469_18755 [Candidatus Kapabacteria bacterium]|nr:hypothetical protein [Candidatus Kapabacteria bacterium]
MMNDEEKRRYPGFKGKWIAGYNPDQFEYPHILAALADIHERLDDCRKNAAYKWVIFDKRAYAHPKGFTFETSDTYRNKPGAFPIDIKPKKNNIKNVLLAHPALLNDKRWETIHFTTAALFLGSALREADFNVSTQKLILPVAALDDFLKNGNGNIDLLGLTLFEDLFKETRVFLDRLAHSSYNGLLAAGGPMITLNTLQSAWHLPELNLLVRGEAEFVLPRLLNAINANDPEALMSSKGFLFQVPGIIIISDLDHINRPQDFSGFRFHMDFLGQELLQNGLEINLSRGCGRGCSFCSHVQGREIRELPTETFEQLLCAFSEKLDAGKVIAPYARSININDDDILQDIDYAEKIFQSIKKHGYKLWGIQTSVNSFFSASHTLADNVLDTIADESLYVDNNRVVWVGTDAFLKERGKKLGKWIPSETQMSALLGAFEERGIRNFHYWISSDYDTGWEEFTREFLFIYRLYATYKTFGLIAHSPFLVPYPSTPLYRQLLRLPGLQSRIKYKQILKGGKQIFEFPLVERVETGYPFLNRLLNNEKWGNRLGFFDYLKQKDYLNASITLYDFLKQERLSFESIHAPKSPRLVETEKELEIFIANII